MNFQSNCYVTLQFSTQPGIITSSIKIIIDLKRASR